MTTNIREHEFFTIIDENMSSIVNENMSSSPKVNENMSSIVNENMSSSPNVMGSCSSAQGLCYSTCLVTHCRDGLGWVTIAGLMFHTCLSSFGFKGSLIPRE